MKREVSRDLETLLLSSKFESGHANDVEIEKVLKLYGGQSSKNCSKISAVIRARARLSSSVSEYECEVDPSDYTDQLAKHFYNGPSKIEALVARIRRNPEYSAEDALALTEEIKKRQILKEGGSRILVLDGGGFGGMLVEIQVLTELEKITGVKASELFDWIIATSAGSFVAATTVMGKCILSCVSIP